MLNKITTEEIDFLIDHGDKEIVASLVKFCGERLQALEDMSEMGVQDKCEYTFLKNQSSCIKQIFDNKTFFPIEDRSDWDSISE